MNETGFIVVYVGRTDSSSNSWALPRYNIGDRLIVTEITVSTTTGITYYTVTNGRTSGAWYDAELFKRLDDIRAEKLNKLGL
jgi:hypothetical protein